MYLKILFSYKFITGLAIAGLFFIRQVLTFNAINFAIKFTTMNYSDWKMNIKHLTEYLMSYVSAMENDNVEETERLKEEILSIFDRLHSVNSDESKKEEIINLILLKMQEKSLTHLDVATYTRDLVIHGFK